MKDKDWKIIAIIFIVGFFVTIGFLDYRSYQSNQLEEEFEEVAENMLNIIKYCAESNNITMSKVIENSFVLEGGEE